MDISYVAMYDRLFEKSFNPAYVHMEKKISTDLKPNFLTHISNHSSDHGLDMQQRLMDASFEPMRRKPAVRSLPRLDRRQVDDSARVNPRWVNRH